MESNNTLCQKGAVCTNTNGSYYCDCPPGYYRDDDKPEYECVRDKGKHNPALLVSSGIKFSHCLPHVYPLLSLEFVVNYVPLWLIHAGIAVTLVLLILLAISFWLN